jgi:hypothetical protein
MSAPQRHSWGERQVFPHKTERECQRAGCGIVRVSRHEGTEHWVEFWRDQERLETPDDRTPPCEGSRADG